MFIIFILSVSLLIRDSKQYTWLVLNISFGVFCDFLSYLVSIGDIHSGHDIRNIIKQAGTKSSDIFISGRGTGYWTESPTSSEIFLKFQTFLSLKRDPTGVGSFFHKISSFV